MGLTSERETVVGIDLVLRNIVHPAIRLDDAGRIGTWNVAAADRFPWLAAGEPFAKVAPSAIAALVVGALASFADELVFDGHGARFLRLDDDDRLLLFDCPEVDVFHELRAGVLVWEYEGDELRSADDLRLIAANPASEEIGPRMPMRSLLDRMRGEINPIDALSPLYLQVARTGEAAEVELADSKGDPFIIRVFPLPRRRLAIMFRPLLPSEEKYRTLVENLPVVLWTIDQRGSLFVSRRSERITGYTAEEIVHPDFGAVWAESVHPDDLGRAVAAYQGLFRDGTAFDIEYRFRRKDGVWRWLSDHAVHTYEKDGRIFASGMSQDITERKRAESQQLALAGFGRRALTSTDEQSLLTDACRTVVEVLEVPKANTLMLDAEESTFTFPATYGKSPTPADKQIPNDPMRLPTQTLTGGVPIVYGNLQEESRFFTEELLSMGTRAGIAAPIFGRAARYGVLHAQTNEPREFSEREAAFVQSMANILAEAIERNRAERELERQKVQLSDAQAIARIGSLRVDLQTQRVEWSDELYRIFGMEPKSQEITLEWLASRMAPDSRERLLRLPERFRAGETVDEEHIIYALDGVTRVTHYRARPITDRLTGRATIVGTVQDITAAKQAEATLRDHERRLQVIVSRLPVMLFSTDMELRLTSVTGEGFAPMPHSMLSDLTLADLIGPDPEENGPQLALNGRETTYDTWHGERDLRVHIEPLTDETTGVPIGVVGIAFDVSDEKRVEEANRVLLERLHDAAAQWRDTFDSIQAPMLILDDELRVRRMNAAALRFSCFTDYLEALEQPVTSFGDAPIWREIHALARKARREKRSAAVQHADEDGRVWDLFASSGERQTVIIVSEVTEVVRMQRNLRRAEVMSEMGALVAGVAHEVRNPLFGLSATLDAFETKFGTAQFQDYVSALREQVDRMSQLMHELLEYGRPVASDLRRYDPAPVLRRAIDSMEPLARQSGVNVRCRIPGMLPQVRMDRQRLLQVFENLLKNAIQHSVNGTDVEISAIASDDGCMSIEVADRGAGFAPDDLERVFEPFFTRRRGGTGLGLSLARRIVDEHHGAIRASNREGGGAAMIVTLPIADTARHP